MADTSHTPAHAERAEQLYQALRLATDAQLRELADLLAAKPDEQLFGPTEFQVRDLVHKIGATALQAAAEQRKKGGTRAPA